MDRKAPFFTFAVGVSLEDKPIDVIAFTKISLAILALVLVGYLFVELEERWKERVGCVVGGEQGGMFRDERRHVRERSRDSARVIKLDEIMLGGIGEQRIQSDVHDGARTKNSCSWMRMFNASTRRERFFLDLRTVTFK